MPWQNQGGPWGGGGSGGGSGGSGGGSGGPWGRPSGGGGGGGPRQPDVEEMLRRTQDRLRRILPGGGGGVRGLALVAVAALALWVITGFYRVDAGEQGVGQFQLRPVSTTLPGLNWNWPTPIGSVETPNVEFNNRVEIGLRSVGDGSEGTSRDVPAESLMLTGDENIIDIQFVVFWKVKDAGAFLFNVRDPEGTVKNAAEAAMREIVGQSPFERVRTVGRADVQNRTLELIQQILDSYGAGILVTKLELQKIDPPGPVLEAFRDVQAARADKERLVNEAQAYYNEITERAEGQSQQIIKGAEAYREEKIAIATGDAARFISIYNEYQDDADITIRRIYLETMERIMGDVDKVLIDNRLGGTGAVPYLSLNELVRERTRLSSDDLPAASSATTTDPQGVTQ